MKILLVTLTGREMLGIIGNYCRKALEALGNEVVVFDFLQRCNSKRNVLSLIKSKVKSIFPFLPSPYDLNFVKSTRDRRINSMLFNLAKSYRPDILLVLFGYNITPQTISEIKKETGAVTVNWFYDSVSYAHRRNFLETVIPSYDYLFIIDSKDALKELKVKCNNICTIPLACCPDVHKRIDLSEEDRVKYGSDIAFVGTMSPQREEILEALSDFDLGIWGHWEKQSPRLKACYREQNVYEEKAVKVYNASKIIIDIQYLYGTASKIYNVSPRMFEVPASGGFLLANDTDQIHDFYKVGEEIITYKDIDDLRDLIKYYLEHPQERQSIAEKAYQKVHREHTYFQRLERLLKTIRRS